MAPFTVHIKHAGKAYDVQLDTDLPPAAFKDAVYGLTGVPPDRMKVMIKGGMLKDDAEWNKVAPKPGQTFTVIGAAGELPKPPEKPIVFLEDMNDAEMAEALAMPVGLKNLGNTCYMNSTLQALRAIPEIQTALSSPSHLGVLPRALRDLYSNMSNTIESVIPTTFLAALRQVVPQFNELDRSRSGPLIGYAQQDAEECWTQMINALKDIPGIDASGASVTGKNVIDQFLVGEMRRELKCDESSEELATITTERVLKIECNITISTNYMHTGIMDSLNSKLTKQSPSLGREATYTQTSRLSRLPAYLSLHMVRFAWRRDIGKKAKIMRKVKFTTEFDAIDIVTPELKEKLTPVSRRLKEIEKERFERSKVRKRTKNAVPVSAPAPPPAGESSMNVDEAAASSTTEELEDESVYRAKELTELQALVDPELEADFGCSVTGLYDLVAIVTHKGAHADSGHYMGFVKKSVFHGNNDTDDEDWYKFDDDKVSIFPKEKLSTIDGGGEDSSAYVLLYKSKSLA